MINRNEVIQWLKNCVYDMPYCHECPYNYHVDCKHFLMKDVFELLKEQESVEPTRKVDEHGQMLLCGNCGAWLVVRKQKYCHNCGGAVKWDETHAVE